MLAKGCNFDQRVHTTSVAVAQLNCPFLRTVGLTLVRQEWIVRIFGKTCTQICDSQSISKTCF